MGIENFVIHDLVAAHKLKSTAVTETATSVHVSFAWADVLYHQTELQAIWRKLNLAKSKNQ